MVPVKHKGDAMRALGRLRNKKGQSFIEYALVVAIVSAAVAAMSTYVFRSVQATQQAIQDELKSD